MLGKDNYKDNGNWKHDVNILILGHPRVSGIDTIRGRCQHRTDIIYKFVGVAKYQGKSWNRLTC